MPIAVYRQNISGFSLREILLHDVDTNELFSELSNQMALGNLQVYVKDLTHAEGVLLSGETPDALNATLLISGAPKLRRGGRMLLVNLPIGTEERELLNTLAADYVNKLANSAKLKGLDKCH